YGLITILPIFAVHPWTFSLEQLFTAEIGFNLFYLGVVASFVCFAAWAWVMTQLGALRASNYIYFNPVTTVIASAIVLNERMTPIAYAGSAFILIGVFVVNKSKNI
ncbi:MAG: DMT family transporter, partial [Prevotella pallens]|nr:DMT family transporter [Prevotella pallens]